MKKNTFRFVVFVLSIGFCLSFFSACHSPKDQSETGFLKVYVEASTLSEAGRVFAKSIFAGNYRSTTYVDDSVPPVRSEVVFGKEVTLHYQASVDSHILYDSYVSEDERYSVHYQRSTGKIICMNDRDHPGLAGEPLSEEESIRIAKEFAAEKWDFIRDGECSVQLIRGSQERLVGFFRLQSGLQTDEFVQIGVGSDGSVMSWRERIVYSDGFPLLLQQAVAKLDQELCRQSVKRYIQECADDNDKKIVFDKFSYAGLVIDNDGTVTWRTYAKVSVDGNDTYVAFHVEIPIENSDAIITEAPLQQHFESAVDK